MRSENAPITNHPDRTALKRDAAAVGRDVCVTGQAPTGCQAVFSSVRASSRLSGSPVAAS